MDERHTGMIIVDGQPMRASSYMRRQRREQILDKIVGYIYIIRCGSTTYYKIGQAKSDCVQRLLTLQIGCPYQLDLIHYSQVSNYLCVETYLHQKFRLQQVRGEWFDLSDEDIDYIKSVLASPLDIQTLKDGIESLKTEVVIDKLREYQTRG